MLGCHVALRQWIWSCLLRLGLSRQHLHQGGSLGLLMSLKMVLQILGGTQGTACTDMHACPPVPELRCDFQGRRAGCCSALVAVAPASAGLRAPFCLWALIAAVCKC